MKLPHDFLRPIVNGWIGKIEQARRAREPWVNVANDCLMFFADSQGFWNPQYLRKMGFNGATPKFQLTMNRAFEMVATFGPSLYFRNPHRTCQPRARSPVNFQMLLPPPPPGMPPEQAQMMQQQMLQQMQMQEQQEEMSRKLTADLMGDWLNYTPGECGLALESKMVIQDALLTGRGVMLMAPETYPGTDQLITCGKRIDPFALYLDSDFARVEECRWMAIERREPFWVVERKFQLQPNTLRHACSLESEHSRGERYGDPYANAERNAGKTNDLVTYYEIYSKTGPGGRLAGMETGVRDHLEGVVGDYAYLAVCKNVPYPLNAPSEKFHEGATDEDVKQMFAWPIEYWKDQAWPVTLLDFYPHPKRPWPIAPMAPGLGELKFLNIMMSHLCNRIWSSSRDFIAVLESAMETVEKALTKGEDLQIIPVPPIFGDIQKMLQVIQFPQVNIDVWTIIERVSQEFERRTGLNALLAGQNVDGTQNRTAAETSVKKQAAGVRPAYMQQCTVDWLSKISRAEAICAHAFVRSKDTIQLLGPMRSQLWDQYVAANDLGLIAREFIYTVGAADMRAPDKDRDIANAGQMMATIAPIAHQYAMATTDTKQINAAIGAWGKATDTDVAAMQFGAWMPPPPPPPVQQAQEASGQLGVQQQAADVEKTYAEIEKIEADTKTTLKPPKDPNKKPPAKKAA